MNPTEWLDQVSLLVQSALPTTPEGWAIFITTFLVLARTFADWVIRLGQRYDAVDGKVDWPWLATAAKVVKFIDDEILDHLPVKSATSKSRK